MSYYEGVTFRFSYPASLVSAELERFKKLADRQLPGARIEMTKEERGGEITRTGCAFPETRRGAFMQQVDPKFGTPKGPRIDTTASSLGMAADEVILEFYRG